MIFKQALNHHQGDFRFEIMVYDCYNGGKEQATTVL
jgi:hypothetical protein